MCLADLEIMGPKGATATILGVKIGLDVAILAHMAKLIRGGRNYTVQNSGSNIMSVGKVLTRGPIWVFVKDGFLGYTTWAFYKVSETAQFPP